MASQSKNLKKWKVLIEIKFDKLKNNSCMLIQKLWIFMKESQFSKIKKSIRRRKPKQQIAFIQLIQEEKMLLLN